MFGRKVSQGLPSYTNTNTNTNTNNASETSVETKKPDKFSMLPSLPAVTIYALGFTAFITGFSHLMWPTDALIAMHLPTIALPVAKANSLAAIAMGIYYTLAAYQENRAFFQLTVPMRLLSATVFWDGNAVWKKAAVWEGVGALLTGVALLWEDWLRDWLKEQLGYGEEKVT